MNIKVDVRQIPFSNIQKLNIFENELSDEIKRLLNESYNNINVKLTITVIEREDVPIRIKHNASPFLLSSKQLVHDINNYIGTRDDLEPILTNITLLIDIQLSEKEKKKGNDMDSKEPQKKDETPDFFPSTPRYKFEQIILDDNIKQEIFDAVKVLECKDLIYNQWGFGEIDPVPRSILNFYGEPGTGKTMCAHAIANHLGKKILALNYSEIESKYVGEAPKNLQKAFDVAKKTDSVLFFDEADSFLGKRIENVTQGADQALNSLRSQMLILLEEFSGVVLFATNLVTNFDPAFESRILKHIRFNLPNLEARAAIIKKMIPSRLPVERPFTDEEFLEASAIVDGFSGREIKGAILDLILSKANLNDSNIVFTIEDLYSVLNKKKTAKIELKAEEERRLKDKISKKLKEKAEEAKAIKEQQEQTKENDSENDSENKEGVDK